MRTVEQVRSPRSTFRSTLLACLALAAPSRAGAVELRYPQADLHGFPSMQNEAGEFIADGELTQRKEGTRLIVRGTWRFRDGRVAVEDDVLALRSEEHTSELQSPDHLVCRLLLEKKKRDQKVIWFAAQLRDRVSKAYNHITTLPS